MIRSFSLQDVARACGLQQSLPALQFLQVSTDSRHIGRGDLFVALKGERFDGHDYLAAVEQAGACAAVVECKQQDVSLPQLVVNNTVKALGQVAQLNRQQFTGRVVAITGSSGKTTVKEMLAAILATHGNVLATRGNLNNHLGVPLTLLRIDASHQYAVIEMGASALGEIDYLAQLAQPHVSVVNNVGSAHIGGFGSRENIARGKGEIYRHLGSDGVAVINGDDAFAGEWLEQTAALKRIVFSVRGPASAADVYAEHIHNDELAQAHFTLCHASEGDVQRIGVHLPLAGEHHVANALAAAACAIALNIDLLNIQRGLESVAAVSGRMEIKRHASGALIIDDSYNANASSMKAAIDALMKLSGRHVAILGAMAELGEYSERLHREVGAYAKQLGVDRLLVCGEPARPCAEAFGEAATFFDSRDQLLAACMGEVHSGVVCLVKGSRSAGMEQVVNALMEAPTTC